MYDAYSVLEPETLRYQHIWIASSMAWRPVMEINATPLMLYWAWTAYKTRRAQSFQSMNKTFIDKYCGTKQTVKGSSRQQWTVRHWFHFYGLHKLKWGGSQWYRRLFAAYTKQLGPKANDDDGLKYKALVDEFATFIHGQVVSQFGAKTASKIPVKVYSEEALKQHGYISTAMVRILAAARDEFGVVSPNGFRNRLFQDPQTIPIWFALNKLGSQTAHIEGQGILSHFYEEVTEGRAIDKPMFDNAIKGLEAYRQHHVDQRKLKDLDESEAYDYAAESEARKHAPEDTRTAEERYARAEQLIT
jgi:hypothetical protein